MNTDTLARPNFIDPKISKRFGPQPIHLSVQIEGFRRRQTSQYHIYIHLDIVVTMDKIYLDEKKNATCDSAVK